MKNLLDYNLAQLESLLAEIDEKPYRAKQLFNWIYKQGIYNIDRMTNLSQGLKKKLSSEFEDIQLEIIEIQHSSDNCHKALFRHSNVEFESVAIPASDGRMTFCLSTQSGCKVGCRFCATARMGFKRNLSAGEIVGQVLQMASLTSRPDNIVLMGMGESLMNLEAVDQFINIISNPDGFGLSERRITLSTAGLMKELKEFHMLHPQTAIAVSLNAADNKTRRQIMPGKMLSSFQDIISYLPRFDCDITLEYVLLQGINNSVQDARKLAAALRPHRNVKVNLIRFNPIASEYRSASEQSVIEFQNILMSSGIKCFIRRSMGSDIEAACGQLAGKRGEPHE